MKRITPPYICSLFVVAFLLGQSSCNWNHGQSTEAITVEADTCKYISALDLSIINRGFENTEMTFQRLPDSIKDKCREDLWRYSKHSSGIAIRFATNSSTIGVRYQLLEDFRIPNMAEVGVKGIDLYTFGMDSTWHYIMSYKPACNQDRVCEGTLLNNADTTKLNEYLMYLPLFDGVTQLEVRLSKDADVTSGDKSIIDDHKKIVYYGTSIIQGGSASRPGMGITNIITRELNREVVNLGFSGQGKLDYCVAEVMAQIPDVATYVIDPVPNCDAAMCDTLTHGFVKILKDAHPEIPVILIGGPMHPHAHYNGAVYWRLNEKNDIFKGKCIELMSEYNDIIFVDSSLFDNMESEGTIDGIHLTDYGSRQYADIIIPILKEVLSRQE